VVSAPALYSEGAGFKSQPGDWLLCGFSWFYSVPPGKYQYSTTSCQNLSNLSFTYHPIIRCYIVSVTEKAVFYLSKHNQSGSATFPQERSRCIYVTMREHGSFDDQVLHVAKFTNITVLLILILCQLSFPTFGLKLSSLLTLPLKSCKKIFISYLGN
jgi:hypothetical protein